MLDFSTLSHAAGWDTVVTVNGLLLRWGIQSFVVGGWVRDSLLGKPTRDIDFVVDGDGLEIARRMAVSLDGKFVPLDNDNRVGRVVLAGAKISKEEDRTIDFATLTGGTIEEDLQRRDFTVDAIAFQAPSVSGVRFEPIDPCRGFDDLENRIIRATSGDVFAADPVRLLRAFRLAAQLGFSIEPETGQLIRRDAGLISRTAGERIREELVLLLSCTGSGRFLVHMEALGLLTGIIPELQAAVGVAQPREHHWDVLRHSLETVNAFDFLIHQTAWEYADEGIRRSVPWLPEASAYFQAEVSHGSTRETLFRLAAVLHDNAKPQTRTVEPGGKVRFLGHALQGSDAARSILERLRFSTREIRLVETAIKYHLRPTQMGWPGLPSKRAVYRYYRDTGEASLGVLYLSLADHLAMSGPALDLRDWQIHTDTVSYILSQQTVQPSPKNVLVDGYDIMNKFSLHPGRQVGELLEIAREAQASGQVATKDEALKLLQEVLNGHVIPRQDQDKC